MRLGWRSRGLTPNAANEPPLAVGRDFAKCYIADAWKTDARPWS